MKRALFLRLALASSLAVIFVSPGQAVAADAYPSKPIKLVVPYSPGGLPDTVARVLAQRLQDSMGQPVVVENRAGAGGNIGGDAVAKSPPDGYTVLIHNVAFPLASIVAAQANRAPFNIDADFAGVSIVAYVPFVILAHPSVPAKDLRELATLLRNSKSVQSRSRR